MPDDLPPGIEALPNGQWVVEGDTHFTVWSKARGNIVTDPHVMDFLRPYLEKVEVIWDLGANIGDHTRAYLDMGKKVVAVEPHPISHACLAHNCPQATILNVAASHEAGSLPFMSLDNVGASRIHKDGEWSVPCVAMDDVPDLPPPGFIKADLEGWEPNAIVGMAGTITRHKPIIFTEMNRGALEANGFTVEGYREQIESLGYRVGGVYPPKAACWKWPQFDVIFLPIK